MSERNAVITGSIAGAALGIAVAYLVFTDRGRTLRERIEPAIDELKHDFARFQTTFEKVGAMANDGVRVFQEFSAARSQSRFNGDSTSH